MVREWSIERDERILKELYPETAKKDYAICGGGV